MHHIPFTHHAMASTLVVKTAVHGYMYHVYRTVWEPHIGKESIAVQASGNFHYRYMLHMMAVYSRDPDIMVGLLPQGNF